MSLPTYHFHHLPINVYTDDQLLGTDVPNSLGTDLRNCVYFTLMQTQKWALRISKRRY